jgi:hypothetical protein
VFELLLALAILATAGLALGSGAAVTAWRRERRRSRRLAEQLLVDGHIEWLTTQTLQAMRQAVRQQWRERP